MQYQTSKNERNGQQDNRSILLLNNKAAYFGAYTICFILLGSLVFFAFWLGGKSFIHSADGWRQHYKATVYYAHYLKTFIKTLITEHRLAMPEFDFHIGEGADILNTLHYYVIGDPIAAFAVFVPARYIHYFYTASSVLRLYLSGVSFSVLAFGTKCKNNIGILVGALSYCFSFWCILSATTHPFFLNPMIWFPLIIFGIEKVFLNERPYLLIIMTAVAAGSNMYFFFIISALTAVYLIIRIGYCYRNRIQAGLKTLIKVGAFMATGVCMAGGLTVPVIYFFTHDPRIAANKTTYHFFYPASYYSALPAAFVSGIEQRWLCIGLSAPVVMAIVWLFVTKKRNRMLKALVVVSIGFTLLPICGSFFNGMSYAINRWSWVLALLGSYILVVVWDDLISGFSFYQKKVIALFGIILALLLLLRYPHKAGAITSFAIILILIICLCNHHWSVYYKQMAVFATAFLSIVNIGWWHFSFNDSNYMSYYVDNNRAYHNLMNTEASIIQSMDRSTNNRFTGVGLSENANMIQGVSSTQFYWTNNNPTMAQYRIDMGMREESLYQYEGYDDRAIPNALAAVAYYISPDINKDLCVPYGFHETSDGDGRIIERNGRKYGIRIFKNSYKLPLGYCYDQYISHESWNKLDSLQKQEIQLDAAYTLGQTVKIPHIDKIPRSYKLDYQILSKSSGVTSTDKAFITTSDNATVQLQFDGKPNSELYLTVRGLDYRNTSSKNTMLDYFFHGSEQNISIGFSTVSSRKVLPYKPPDARYASGRRDFLINLGYNQESIQSITITFPQKGVYKFRDISVACVPMSQYQGKIERLKRNSMQSIQLEQDEISGSITAEKRKLLTIAVPYSGGWRAYVDSKETPVIQVNERYLGLELEPGNHTVKLRYSRPWQREGFICTGSGLFITLVIWLRRKRKDNKVLHG